MKQDCLLWQMRPDLSYKWKLSNGSWIWNWSITLIRRFLVVVSLLTLSKSVVAVTFKCFMVTLMNSAEWGLNLNLVLIRVLRLPWSPNWSTDKRLTQFFTEKRTLMQPVNEDSPCSFLVWTIWTEDQWKHHHSSSLRPPCLVRFFYRQVIIRDCFREFSFRDFVKIHFETRQQTIKTVRTW